MFPRETFKKYKNSHSPNDYSDKALSAENE